MKKIKGMSLSRSHKIFDGELVSKIQTFTEYLSSWISRGCGSVEKETWRMRILAGL